MIEKILYRSVDWLEGSRLPPVIGAIMIMLFALWQIWRQIK